METARKCQACGAEIVVGTYFGHCPKCLLLLGLAAPEEPSAPTEPSVDALNRAFGDYQLLELIGRGGMGVVYKAQQASLNRLVALKMVRDWQDASPVTLTRFRLEAEAAGRLDHPNIVPTYQVGEEDGQPFFSMKLIEGANLAKRYPEFVLIPAPGSGGPTAPPGAARDTQVRIAALIAAVAHAIHYAHQHGVIHRDLKPTNILIDAEGQPHLTDFGVAKVLEKESELTHTNDVLGTPAYMAPEQVSGKGISAAVDIYSIGAILYELLTGRPPFRGQTPLETLRKSAEEEPVCPTTLSRSVNQDLSCICLKCLEKDPLERYGSALALAEDLERWLRREPILAKRTGRFTRTLRWVQRNPLGALLILTLSASLIGTLLLLRVVAAEQKKSAGVLKAFKEAAIQNEGLLSVSVEMLREQLEGLWLRDDQTAMTIASEKLAVLSGRPYVKVDRRVPIEHYRFGIAANESPVTDALRYAAFLACLEQRLSERRGLPVRFDLHVFKFKEDRVRALGSGEIDFARMGSYVYLQAQQEYPGIQALVEPESPPSGGIFFTRTNTGIQSLADLKSRIMAFGDRSSGLTINAQIMLVDAGLTDSDLGGYVFIDSRSEFAEEVHELGYEAAMKRRLWLHSTADVIEDVLDRRYDAGVTSSRALAKHQSRGLVPIPGSEFTRRANPWIARANLPADLVRDFVAVVTALTNEPALRRLPDCPTGYRIVAADRYVSNRYALRRIEGLFTMPVVVPDRRDLLPPSAVSP